MIESCCQLIALDFMQMLSIRMNWTRADIEKLKNTTK